jgi:serine/threonine protein kinase
MMEMEARVEIGDFSVVRRLGAGGMGVVYLAQQKSLDRLVALKVLGAALAHPGDVIRFKREAQAAAKLNHPGIATIHYVGQDEQACYMAMDYIDGITLRQLIDRVGATSNPNLGIETVLHESAAEPKPPQLRFDDLTVEQTGSAPDLQQARQALESITPAAARLITSKSYINRVCDIVRDAALALQHAHDNRVVHRDIKPQNIMLDRNGQVHVIDFGVARYFDGTVLTQTGALVGTPMYMSPEQVAGRMNVDHRSDIYSLGLVLYELLTLRRPIYAPSREAVLRGVVTKAMIPVSWKNNGVPRSVENVVHKAIAKDPDERYQHAADFAEDLQRCGSGQSVLAEPYRYRFDEREIRAERPWSVSAAAFWFCFAAIFYVLIWFPYEIGMTASGSKRYIETRIDYFTRGAGYAALAVACSVAAALLFTGRAWSRWLALPVAVVSIGLSLRQPYEVIHAAWLQNNPRYLALMSIWLLTRLAVILGGCLTVWSLLLHSSARRWFQFSSQVRSEHDELITGLHSQSGGA